MTTFFCNALKKFLVGCIALLAMHLNTFAQVTLPDVTVISYNYKYIRAAGDTHAAQPVKMLQRYAASYDIKNSEFYDEEFDDYTISFFIPEGEILATYDKEGKLIRTAEKFKNIALPESVRKAVNNRFMGWAISKDVYLVNYVADSEKESRKLYKLLLENGTKRIRVKTNEKGEFIE